MDQTSARQPSFLKGLALAFATLALSTWALGSLWLHTAEAAADVVTASAQ